MFWTKNDNFQEEIFFKKKPLRPRLMQIWMWDDTESVCSTIYFFDLTFPSRLLQFGKGGANFSSCDEWKWTHYYTLKSVIFPPDT
jgi:hypothetical protein